MRAIRDLRDPSDPGTSEAQKACSEELCETHQIVKERCAGLEPRSIIGNLVWLFLAAEGYAHVGSIIFGAEGNHDAAFVGITGPTQEARDLAV